MCKVTQQVWECGCTDEKFICNAICDAGFDYARGRCKLRNEEVERYYERPWRCQRCRWMNEPKNDPAEEVEFQKKSHHSHEFHWPAVRQHRRNSRRRR